MRLISLEQPREDLVAAFRSEIAEHGVDVVLDYLWGDPAEAVLAAIAQKGLSHAAPRIRFVQIGQSAGATITLAGATLRSSGVELMGSGFGSASMQEIFAALAEFFKEAAKIRVCDAGEECGAAGCGVAVECPGRWCAAGLLSITAVRNCAAVRTGAALAPATL